MDAANSGITLVVEVLVSSAKVGVVAVVEEAILIPVAAAEAVPKVAETVVDSTVEPYARTPVASIPKVTWVAESIAPVARRP